MEFLSSSPKRIKSIGHKKESTVPERCVRCSFIQTAHKLTDEEKERKKYCQDYLAGLLRSHSISLNRLKSKKYTDNSIVGRGLYTREEHARVGPFTQSPKNWTTEVPHDPHAHINSNDERVCAHSLLAESRVLCKGKAKAAKAAKAGKAWLSQRNSPEITYKNYRSIFNGINKFYRKSTCTRQNGNLIYHMHLLDDVIIVELLQKLPGNKI